MVAARTRFQPLIYLLGMGRAKQTPCRNSAFCCRMAEDLQDAPSKPVAIFRLISPRAGLTLASVRQTRANWLEAVR